jgi:hypothetical protein
VPQRLQVKDIPCHSNEMLGRGVKWCLKHVETPEGVKPLGEIWGQIWTNCSPNLGGTSLKISLMIMIIYIVEYCRCFWGLLECHGDITGKWVI